MLILHTNILTLVGVHDTSLHSQIFRRRLSAVEAQPSTEVVRLELKFWDHEKPKQHCHVKGWADVHGIHHARVACEQVCSAARDVGDVGGTMACESALRSAGTHLSRLRTPPWASRPDGGP
ncbi:hypothetical protein PoB_001274400 [Plakobranchus ocellatus]|uniref:Uncharacterized protein n=1 Tax=Plakobranchus ocellatus TaxID=259542 RepID=A0AAV3YW07_9GAST|nr:hypothetical protein PoB_001274400 [Plakobranchus ocellatus]